MSHEITTNVVNHLCRSLLSTHRAPTSGKASAWLYDVNASGIDLSSLIEIMELLNPNKSGEIRSAAYEVITKILEGSTYRNGKHMDAIWSFMSEQPPSTLKELRIHAGSRLLAPFETYARDLDEVPSRFMLAFVFSRGTPLESWYGNWMSRMLDNPSFSSSFKTLVRLDPDAEAPARQYIIDGIFKNGIHYGELSQIRINNLRELYINTQNKSNESLSNNPLINLYISPLEPLLDPYKAAPTKDDIFQFFTNLKKVGVSPTEAEMLIILASSFDASIFELYDLEGSDGTDILQLAANRTDAFMYYIDHINDLLEGCGRIIVKSLFSYTGNPELGHSEEGHKDLEWAINSISAINRKEKSLRLAEVMLVAFVLNRNDIGEIITHVGNKPEDLATIYTLRPHERIRPLLDAKSKRKIINQDFGL